MNVEIMSRKGVKLVEWLNSYTSENNQTLAKHQKIEQKNNFIISDKD